MSSLGRTFRLMNLNQIRLTVAGLTLVGSLLTLLQVARGAAYPGIVASLFLLVVPQVVLAASKVGIAHSRLLLAAAGTSAATVFYMFAFQAPILVGTDSPAHLSRVVELLRTNHYDVGLAPGASYQFPHMYFLYGIIYQLAKYDLATMTVWLAPAINLIAPLFLYAAVRNIAGSRAAYFTTLLYSLEYFAFFFGFEFRTQSYSLIFLLAVVHLVVARKTPSISRSISVVIFLLGLVTSHLVTATQGIALLVIISLSQHLSLRRTYQHTPREGATISILGLVLLVAYMSLAAPTIDSALPYVLGRLSDVFSGSLAISANVRGLAVDGYMPIVMLVQWSARILFLGCFGALVVRTARRPSSTGVLMVLASTYFGVLLLADTIGTGLLSPGRWGMYFDVFFATTCALGISWLSSSQFGKPANVAKIVLIGLYFFAYSVGNVGKLPTWLIGTDVGPTAEFSYDGQALLAANHVGSLTSLNPGSQICGNAYATGILRSAGLHAIPLSDVPDSASCSHMARGGRFMNEGDPAEALMSQLYTTGDFTLSRQ